MSPELPVPDQQTAVEKAIAEMLATYDARTGVLDGRNDSTLLINALKLQSLIKDLCKLEHQNKRVHVKIYTDTKVYKEMGRRPLLGAKRLALNLLKKKSFYVEIYDIQFDSPPSLLLSRQVFYYFRDNETNCLYLSSSAEPICSIFYPDDLEVLYPRVNDSFSYCTAQQKTKDISDGYEVDVVITWVDSNDSVWKEKWEEGLLKHGKKFINHNRPDRNNIAEYDPDRFACSNELLYCVRSILTYMGWVRNIFIVSNCTPPSWLDTKHHRIKWVNHSEIIAAEALPTFNSHAIESCLHKIKDLAEHFIYFNDDFVILKPTSRSAFFDKLGRPYINSENYSIIRESYVKINKKDYSFAAVNSLKSIQAMGFSLPSTVSLHAHVPYSHKKSLIAQASQLFKDQFYQTEMSPYRSPSDINVMSFFAHWFGYSNGSYMLKPLSNTSDYLLVRPENIHRLVRGKYFPRFACFNDGDGTSTMNNYKEICEKYLKSRLISRSFAEK